MHWVAWVYCGDAIVVNVSSTIPAGGGGGEAGTGDANAICCCTSDRPYGIAGMVTWTCSPVSCLSISVEKTLVVGCAR